MQHSKSNRVVFYIDDQQLKRLNEAVEASDMEKADWLRQALDSAATGAASSTETSTSEAHGALAAAQERIRGLEELLQQARERQGMSDSLNQELNQRLKESHATVDGFRLMLPAAGQTERRWWQFW